MKLHEAIEEAINVLVYPATIQEITNIINQRNLYKRGDDKPVQNNQVAARINNYPLLFEINEKRHVVLKKETQLQYQRLVYQLQDLLRSHNSRHTDIIIATYIFLERTMMVFPDYTNTPYSKTKSSELKQKKSNYDRYKTFFELSDDDANLISELFYSLPNDLELKISSLLRHYDFSLQASSHRQFGAFFNNLLSSFSVTRGALGDFATPQAVLKIITSIADIKYNHTVFDPFGGNAGIFCDIFRSKESYFKLTLNDADRYAVWLGKMNLVLSDFRKFEYSNEDSVMQYFSNQSNLEKYDWVITHPPFAGKLFKDIVHSTSHRFFQPSVRSELVFLDMILGQLKDTGKAIVVVPESFLFTEDKAFLRARRFLVGNSLVSTVISLPTGTFLPHTSAKASIIVINNDVSEGIHEGVQFVDLLESDIKSIETDNEFSLTDFINTNIAQTALVSKEEIEEQGHSLVVNRYLNRATVAYSNEYKQLKEIITEKFSGTTFNQKALSRVDGVPYVNIKDLSDEKKFYKLNPEKIDTFVMRKFYEGNPTQRHVPNQAVLLAKIGNKLKPTLNAASKLIAVSGNILVLVPKTELISPIYLISQFHEEYVLNQVNRIRGGAAQPFVRIDDLLNIYIKVPSLKEQKEREMMFTLGQMENLPNREMQEINPLDEEIDLPSAIKHEYKNLKNPLSSNISNIWDFLNDKINSKETISWDDKIAANIESRSVKSVFEDVNELMTEMSSLIDDIVTVVNIEKKTVQLNKKNVACLPYLRKVVNKIEHEFPQIKTTWGYTSEKTFNSLVIQIDDNLFSKVLRNFISNTDKHGYPDSTEKPVSIFLSLTDDELMLQIDLINDGKPFDEDFTFHDFISFGKKTGQSKGAGIGGFIMNRIVLQHEGTFEMINPDEIAHLDIKPGNLLKIGVHFRIKLPIVK